MTLRRLGFAVAVVLLAVAALWSARREITHALLVERARALGLSEFSVDVTSLNFGHATLANLRVDARSPAPSRIPQDQPRNGSSHARIAAADCLAEDLQIRLPCM